MLCHFEMESQITCLNSTICRKTDKYTINQINWWNHCKVPHKMICSSLAHSQMHWTHSKIGQIIIFYGCVFYNNKHNRRIKFSSWLLSSDKHFSTDQWALSLPCVSPLIVFWGSDVSSQSLQTSPSIDVNIQTYKIIILKMSFHLCWHPQNNPPIRSE